MSRNVLLAFLALAVPAILLVLWQSLADAPEAGRTQPAARETRDGPAAPARLAQTEAPARAVRDELDVPAAPGDAATPVDTARSAAAVPPQPREAVALRGRVVDADGRTLAGVPLRREGREEVLARSDGAGRFELRLGPGDSLPRLVARGDGFAPLRATVVRDSNRDSEHVVLAAPSIDVAGHVASTAGAALEGALVELALDAALRARFPLPLDATSALRFQARTDASGAFALEGIPALEGAVIRANLAGHEEAAVPEPPASRADLVLLLGPAAQEQQQAITGVVLLPSGEPAARARVGFGFDDARTAGDGRFALPLPREPYPDLPLVAGLAGEGVVHLPDFGAAVRAAAPHAPPPVTLVLPGRSRSISGHVVDARGEPLAGWIVSITEGTPASRKMMPPILVEGFGGSSLRLPTGRDGSFSLDGLLDRAYPIRAYERSTLRCLLVGEVPAGTDDLEIRVPDGGLHDRVAGTVVSRSGAPVDGASVSVGLITSQGEGGASWVGGASTVTDEDGRFELEDVPASHVHLDVGGETVVPERVLLDHDGPLDDLRVEVARRRHFRLVLRGDVEGAVVLALDAAGEPLTIYRFQASGWSGFTALSAATADGVCAVSEDVATLELRRGTETVASRSVVLSGDEVAELELTVR